MASAMEEKDELRDKAELWSVASSPPPLLLVSGWGVSIIPSVFVEHLWDQGRASCTNKELHYFVDDESLFIIYMHALFFMCLYHCWHDERTSAGSTQPAADVVTWLVTAKFNNGIFCKLFVWSLGINVTSLRASCCYNFNCFISFITRMITRERILKQLFVIVSFQLLQDKKKGRLPIWLIDW